MQKIFLLLVAITIFLPACGIKPPPTVNNPATLTEPTVTSITETGEATTTETPSKTPKTSSPSVVCVELPTTVSDREEFLFPTENEGEFYVKFDENRTLALQLDRPNMPTYTWYLNGSQADTVGEVVIEFDLIETVPSLHGEYFGFDRAFFVNIHNFDTIPLMPPWPDESVFSSHLLVFGDCDRGVIMSSRPELGVDLRQYAEWDGNHVTITVPYSEFQGASKNLTLQFLPGTTFGNLSVNVWGSEGLNSGTIEEISQTVEAPERDLFHDEIVPIMPPNDNIMKVAAGRPMVESMVFGQQATREGLVINPDGSINMPLVFYDLGKYVNEVQGRYAVVPEGLVSVFTTLMHPAFFDTEQQRQVVDFVFEHMIDKNGQFSGVYDIEQGKMVAAERKVSATPILSALLLLSDVLTNEEIDFIVNSIIANDLVRVGDTLYYAPNGISEDGVMDLNLSDFAVNERFFSLLAKYPKDSGRLEEEFGSAMLLEGFANSLKLVLEGQERNETRLPSNGLRVNFSNDGRSYKLEPSEIFDINNPFFAIGLSSFEHFGRIFEEFEFIDTPHSFASTISSLSGVKDGIYKESQEQVIREGEAMYAEMYNAYTIANTMYESWYHIYNFLKMQPSETAYAPMYNVHTGEMRAAWTPDELYTDYHMLAPFITRFGTPATSMNYFHLVGVFNDDDMVEETAHLAAFNYDMYMSWIFGSQSGDYTNPDLYADMGFNIWGFDSLRHTLINPNPATTLTHSLYSTSGTNMAREDWRQYVMRKLNEFIPDGENAISVDDDFPTFYDHLPETEFLQTD
jgi:hypothetical protein